MDMEHIADELATILERFPRSSPQKLLLEIPRGEVFLLNYLQAHGCARPGQLSDAMQSSTARVSAALNSMEAKGWVRREADSTDRRKTLVTLTPDGAAYLASFRQQARRRLLAMLESIGSDDAAEYLRIMKRFAATVAEEPADPRRSSEA